MKSCSMQVVMGAALFLVGCGPEAPSVRYSGNTLAAKAVQNVKVYRATPPDRPFQELGTVEVSCPTAAQASGFGSVSVEGGCAYDTALQMALDRAAQAGADAIFGLQSSAAGNGSVVSLTAVAIRYTGPPPSPAETPPPAAIGAGTPEERLRKLQQLAKDGLITPEEYARRKAEILKDL